MPTRDPAAVDAEVVRARVAASSWASPSEATAPPGQSAAATTGARISVTPRPRAPRRSRCSSAGLAATVTVW